MESDSEGDMGKVTIIPHSDHRVRILARLHKGVRAAVTADPHGSSTFEVDNEEMIIDYLPVEKPKRVRVRTRAAAFRAGK